MWITALKKAEKITRYKTQYAGNRQVPAWPLTPTAYFVRLNMDFSKAEPKKDLTHTQYWSWGFSIPDQLCILHPSEGKEILNKCCYSYDLKNILIQLNLHHCLSELKKTHLNISEEWSFKVKYKKINTLCKELQQFFNVRVESQFKYKLHINKTRLFNLFSILFLNFYKSYEQKQTKTSDKKINILSFTINLT